MLSGPAAAWSWSAAKREWARQRYCDVSASGAAGQRPHWGRLRTVVPPQPLGPLPDEAEEIGGRLQEIVKGAAVVDETIRSVVRGEMPCLPVVAARLKCSAPCVWTAIADRALTLTWLLGSIDRSRD